MPADKPEAANEGLFVTGVGRMADYEKALIVYFNRPIFDDDLRAFHDSIRTPRPECGFTYEDGLEDAAKACDAESVDQHGRWRSEQCDGPTVAADCAERIRALKQPSERPYSTKEH